MKTCTKCKTEKPTEDFRKHNRSRDGLDTQCRECRNSKIKSNKTSVANQKSHRKRWAQQMARHLKLGPNDY
jgi:hypothetical protein